jgi:hypothetical protein
MSGRLCLISHAVDNPWADSSFANSDAHLARMRRQTFQKGYCGRECPPQHVLGHDGGRALASNEEPYDPW